MTNRPGLIGTPLRDGAVDPRPTDYLGPVNAGRANPHSTHVVSTQAASPRSGNSPALEPLEDEQG